VIALAASFPYVHALYTLPVGSNNIYEQQYQMHRFATRYWRAPVAVNDLGWVSFRNDEHVLDLWGLGSRPALEARLAGGDWSWVAERTRAKNAKLAMIYAPWFGDVPESWSEIGTLRLGRKLVTVAQPKVTFFALDEAARARAEPLAREFRTTLPTGVEFEMAGGPP
jgi:hypothetical protein